MIVVFCAVTRSLTAQSSDKTILNKDALHALENEVIATNSDAFLLIQGDSLISEWYSNQSQPIELMSCLKSVVSLGVGRLLHQNKLDSLDQPVYTFYPEWKQGQKKNITVRHLLNHTSGLQNVPNAGKEIYPAPDAVQLALAADLISKPGTKFSYNNKAVNLLAGIFQKAAGKRMDHYFQDEIFAPLQIINYKWYLDASGTPHAMAGLQLSARDFAKFGQLILNEGLWDDQQLISASYIKEMLAQGQPFYPLGGLLWWRLPEYEHFVLDQKRITQFRSLDIDHSVISKLKPYMGSKLKNRKAYRQLMKKIFGDKWQTIRDRHFKPKGLNTIFERKVGEIRGYYAEGYLGQYMVILPKAKLIAVRQIKRKESYEPRKDSFDNFKQMVLQLVDENNFSD